MQHERNGRTQENENAKLRNP